jgi:hypothetical protein
MPSHGSPCAGTTKQWLISERVGKSSDTLKCRGPAVFLKKPFRMSDLNAAGTRLIGKTAKNTSLNRKGKKCSLNLNQIFFNGDFGKLGDRF